MKPEEQKPFDRFQPAFDDRVSLRDRFAMAALQGILACPSTASTSWDESGRRLAEHAYAFADDMLAVREDKA